MSVEKLITEHIDIWTAAIQAKSASGRGSNKKLGLYGIKKLRELILELAVRGKLVPQDPNDEPASVLLERIAAEKARLVKEGKIKKPKALPEIAEDEKPFALPVGWECARLVDVYDVRDGTHDTPKYCDQGYPLVTSKNISSGELDFSDVKYISESDHKKISERSLVERNDIIFAMIGSIGNPVLIKVDREFSIKNVALFKYYSSEFSSPLFLLLYLLFAQKIFRQEASGAVQSFISLGKIRAFTIALPPLEEQHRIVAKVDELMALCDQLEQQTDASIEAHQQLVTVLLDSLLLPPASAEGSLLSPPARAEGSLLSSSATAEGSLINSAGADDFMANWARISDHFDTLFTTEASIDALKQTILQLAVMGKLVPQDPNDEPAAKLLERIAAEKARLVKEKKIKKDKPLPAITEDEKPFPLPKGWEWCRVDDVISLKHGYAFKSSYFLDGSGPYVLTTPGSFYETGGFRDRGDKTKYYDGPLDKEFVFEANDLIIPLTEQAPGLLGSAAFIPNDGKIYLHNQRLAKLSPYMDNFSKDYIYWYFNAPYLRSELAKSCSGTTVRHSSPSKVQRALFALPPRNEQDKIVNITNCLLLLCDQLKQRLSDSQQTQLKLTDALVDGALA
ncbi:restriction endonuclease subunit S [Shewanella sp. JM162201]|uniref:Restriction endonuclease subunit S n=1 Tax=Shewanella jiangmenensis TaxID=2837387 RepID=A0ABS5V343_9GAMM|nr:restriction endonuclease subunit S [Shewanella jiangmenensis]MBT1444867.1 restriction endonuclease subunit S [Shewanella jiangmenensis]